MHGRVVKRTIFAGRHRPLARTYLLIDNRHRIKAVDDETLQLSICLPCRTRSY